MKAAPAEVHTKLLPEVLSHLLLLVLSESLIRCTPEETVISSTHESRSVVISVASRHKMQLLPFA